MSYDPNVPADILKISINSLKLLGYQFSYGLRKKSPLSRAHRFISAVRNLYLLIVILNIWIYMLYHGLMAIQKQNQITLKMYGFGALFATVNYLERMSTMWIRRKNIQKMITEVINAHIPMFDRLNGSKMISKIFLLIIIIKNVFIGVTIMLFVFLGLLTMMGVIISINSTEKVHIFLMIIDVDSLLDIVIFAAWIFWTFANFSIFFFSSQLLLFVKISYIVIQCMKVKFEVINALKDIQNISVKQLSGIVDKHENLIKFVGIFNKTFRGTLLFMFILYPFLFFASTSIFLSTNSPVDRLIIALIFIPTVASIYNFCYLCQCVKDECEEIYMEIYNSNWQESKNNKFKQALLIILMQKTCSIKAGIESAFQLKTFMKVMLCVRIFLDFFCFILLILAGSSSYSLVHASYETYIVIKLRNHEVRRNINFIKEKSFMLPSRD